MSHIEIERRFLIRNDSWRQLAGEPQRLEQGYMSVDQACSVRVRLCGEQAWLTVKGYISDLSRSEFEYPVPPADARQMLALCPFRLQKLRYRIALDGAVFEIDEYLGDNAPLLLAEIELPSEHAAYPQPEWLGREVSSDPRFTNAYLSKHPYPQWMDQD